MILVKSNCTNSKRCTIKKFELVTDFDPEDIRLVDDSKIPANTLYKMCQEHIESLNKRLERCRLIERAVECSFNRNINDLLNSNSTSIQRGRVKGKFISSVDSNNGIFIH